MKKNKGFTLVEMLVTITLLGIITLVALPMIRVIQSSMASSRQNVYDEAVLAAAKSYNDMYEMDTFGYQECVEATCCVDVYYKDLVEAKLIEELDFSKTKIIRDKVFVRINKFKGNYTYKTYFPTEDNISSIDFNECTNTLATSGPRITFDPNGSPTPKQNHSTTIKISDSNGIHPNAVITYYWAPESNINSPVDTPKKKEFGNGVVNNLSVNVDSPHNLNGKYVLVVKPDSLLNEIGLASNQTKSNSFTFDNTKPNIVVKIYKENGSGGNTGNVLSNKTNANSSITTWANYGYYLDFSGSKDNGATANIKRQIWEWNASGNVNLDKTLSASRKSVDNKVINKTLTGRGARFGKVTMCDAAENCRSVEIVLNISPIYYIKYTGGESGSISNTKCYYNYDCTLANNKFTKNGYHFNKWKIGNNTYAAGAKVKNLSSNDNSTVTATAQWSGNTYKIRYNGNGNTGGSTAETTCTYGSDCTLRSNGFSRSGHHFTKWKIGNSTYSAGQKVRNLATSGTVTAYAQWSGNTYKIKYNGNGSTGGSTAETTCTYGSNCTLRSNGFSRSGYSFTNWKIGNSTYSAGQTVKNLSTGGDVTAYAQWNVKKYTISYNCNGGWNCPGNQTKTHGVNINLGGTPRRDGWSFQGWSTSSSAHSGYNAGATYSGNSNVTFYATWKRTITVYFRAGKCGWIGDTSRSCSYYNSETSCKINAPGINNIPGRNKDGTSYSDWLWISGWNTDSNADWSSYNRWSDKWFSNDATYYAIAVLGDGYRNRRWFVISDNGLIVRQRPNWNSTGTMHKDTYCRNYGATEWVYRGEMASSNPLWLRVTQYRNPPWQDKCGTGNAHGWDDNCDGWSSATYLRPA